MNKFIITNKDNQVNHTIGNTMGETSCGIKLYTLKNKNFNLSETSCNKCITINKLLSNQVFKR